MTATLMSAMTENGPGPVNDPQAAICPAASATETFAEPVICEYVAVIVETPADSVVTTPALDTAATAAFDELQAADDVTSRVDESLIAAMALSCAVCPGVANVSVPLTVIETTVAAAPVGMGVGAAGEDALPQPTAQPATMAKMHDRMFGTGTVAEPWPRRNEPGRATTDRAPLLFAR